MRAHSWLRLLQAAFVVVALGGMDGGVQAAIQPPAAPASISQVETITLTRSALVALDQANKTGNYTVLRDLGSTTFRANNAARLSEVFADLRRQNVDMSASLAAPLNFASPPAVDTKGLLRVSGSAPLGPRVLYFQIAWAREGGAWRLYGIVVTASQAAPMAAKP